MVLNDFQRGKIPYFVKPPGSEVRILVFCRDSKFLKPPGSEVRVLVFADTISF